MICAGAGIRELSSGIRYMVLLLKRILVVIQCQPEQVLKFDETVLKPPRGRPVGGGGVHRTGHPQSL
jgi:hypothetical protein